MLGISPSGYYAWMDRPESSRRKTDEELFKQIRQIYWANDKRYGSPRIWSELRNKHSQRCAKKRVARIMKETGLVAIQRRKYKATTNSKHDYPVAENLLKRNFTVAYPDKVWVGDITYIWTEEGWLYLAFLLDLCLKKVVGLSMSERITDELTQTALKQAYIRRCPEGELIHHSDRGVQYASTSYQELLMKYNMTASMSGKGDCYDNAVAESFVHTLKVELVHRYRFKTRAEAKRVIFEYVETYYNRIRIHSALGYMNPAEYEKRFAGERTC